MADNFEPLAIKKDENDKMVVRWKKEEAVDPNINKVPLIDKEELEALKNNAINEGYQQGLKEGQSEINALKEQLSETLDLLKKPIKLIDGEIEKAFIGLVTHLTKEILNAEITITPEKLMPYFHEICQYLPQSKSNVKIILSPHDSVLFKASLDTLVHDFPVDNIIEDEALSNGEFRIASDTSEVDGRVETRIRELIRKAFLSQVDESGPTDE